MAQFLQVHPDNPQPRLLKQAAQLLARGGIVAVPTDSSYALVCHVDDKSAADQLRRILEPPGRREVLVERLDRRVKKMWHDGLLEEVQGLIPQGIEKGITARRAIGYAQALAELSGEMTEAEAIEETQAITRRYARRQVSWFKRYADLTWLPVGRRDNVSQVISQLSL